MRDPRLVLVVAVALVTLLLTGATSAAFSGSTSTGSYFRAADTFAP